MKLPVLRYASRYAKTPQIQFGGYHHALSAGDGEIFDMENLCSDHFPVLATRQKRRTVRTLEKPNGIFAWEELCWVDGGTFYYGGEAKGSVSDGEKTFAALGAYVVILPDKKYYNTEADEFGSLESTWSGTVTFENGTLFEEEAEANTIRATGVDWSQYFKDGDAVTISGCTVHPENNKTPVIREIDGDKLRFYENVFKLSGDEGTTAYSESGVTIARTVPDIKWCCENENRLWGCDERTIYCCKLGDIFNWNVFEGLDTDSYAVDTGSSGKFTGCISYLGYPIFFKEDHIYKVYGSMPSNFEMMGSATLGVAEGSAKSLAVAGETLLYQSTAGFMAYSGGIPQPLSEAFGLDRYEQAVGGSDGLKYYVSTRSVQDGTWSLFVYDTQKGVWHREDATQAVGWARFDGNTWCLAADGKMFLTGTIRGVEGEEEADFDWTCEFADFTAGSPDKKGLGRLQLRAEVDEGAELSVWLRFDSVGLWQKVSTIRADVKRSYVLPIVPRRSDHYRVKLSGTGGCRIYSLAREQYSGSEIRTRTGRN